MKTNKLIKYVLVLILAVTIFLRFYNIGGLPHFTYDQARDALFIKRIIVDHKLRLIGTQSSIPGLYTPPFYYYLMAPFLWLANLNPASLDYATAFFGVAAVILLYLTLIKLDCGKWVSLLVTAVFAVQPEILYQTRFAWNPNTTPFFTLLAVYSYLAIFNQKNKLLWYLVLFFALGMLINLHYSGVVLLLAVLLLLWPRKRELKGKNVFLGLAVLFFLISPLLIFDLRHDFINIKGLISYFLYNTRNEALPPPFWLGLVEKYRFLFGLILPKGFGSLTAGIASGISFFGLAAWTVYKKNRLQNFLLFLFFFSLLGASLYQRGFYSFYLTFLYPVPFLILGKSISLINQKTIKHLFFLVLSVTFLVNLIYSYKLISKNSVGFEKQLNQIASLLSETVASPFNLVSVYQGSDRFGHNAVDYRYFLETFYGKKALDWDPLDYQNSSNLYVISEVGEVDPLKKDIWEVSMFNPEEVLKTWQVGDIHIYHLVK